MKNGILVFLLALSTLPTFSQVITVNATATDHQFLGRNLVTNTADIGFNGSFYYNNETLVLYTTYNGITDSLIVPLQVVNNSGISVAYFSINHFLPTRKAIYDLDLVLVKHGLADQSILTVSDIVVGDTYLVLGQSNASAWSSGGWGNSENNSQFIRSFGLRGGINDTTSTINDTTWYIADGDHGVFGPGQIGQWAHRMAKLLLDSTGIPVCILNSADPGKTIDYFQRNDSFPLDINTNYGKMLYRAEKSGLKDKIKAIFYYQGESDWYFAEKHRILFDSLYNDWKKDYPSAKKVFVFQVSPGCNNPSLVLRDNQRKFRYTYNNVEVIATSGLSGNNGCHYTYENGYKVIGERAFRIVKRDFFNGPIANTSSIDIDYITVNNSTRTEFKAYFKQGNSGFIIDDKAAFIADFSISGDSLNTITDIRVDSSGLIFTLANPSHVQSEISYNAHPFGTPGWVFDSNNNSLLTFYKLPVLSNPLDFEIYNFNGILVENRLNVSATISDPNNEIRRIELKLYDQNNRLLDIKILNAQSFDQINEFFTIKECGDYCVKMYTYDWNGKQKLFTTRLVSYNNCYNELSLNILNHGLMSASIWINSESDFTLSIYDSLGKLISRSTKSSNNNNQDHMFNTSDFGLHHGLYLIEVVNEHQRFSKKLFIE